MPEKFVVTPTWFFVDPNGVTIGHELLDLFFASSVKFSWELRVIQQTLDDVLIANAGLAKQCEAHDALRGLARDLAKPCDSADPAFCKACAVDICANKAKLRSSQAN